MTRYEKGLFKKMSMSGEFDGFEDEILFKKAIKKITTLKLIDMTRDEIMIISILLLNLSTD